MGGFALATVVGPIEEMIKTLEKAKESGYKYFIATNELDGQLLSPSKKRPWFRVSFAFLGKAFKSEDLRPILYARKFAILLFKDMSEFSDEAIKLIEEGMKGDGGNEG